MSARFATRPARASASRIGLAVIAFLAGAERPADDCAEREPPTTSCERDDFLKLEVLSAATRGTLLVAVGTSRTYGQVLVVSVFGHWRVLIERWYTV